MDPRTAFGDEYASDAAALDGETHFFVRQSSREVMLQRSLALFDETLRAR
jgi:hypothetical protein